MNKYFTQKESVAIGFLAVAFIIGLAVNYARDLTAKERLEKALPLMQEEKRKFDETTAMLEARYEKENEGVRLNPDGSLISLDLNSVGANALVLLPGIGKVISKRIIEKRNRSGPFKSIEELLEVKGIGPKKFEKIQPFVAIESAEKSAAD